MAENLCGSREASKEYFPSKCSDCENLTLVPDSSYDFPFVAHCGKYGQQRPDMSGGRDIIGYVSKIPEYVERLSRLSRGESI